MRTGDCEVRYGGSAGPADFAQQNAISGTILLHPAVFVETFTIEADFPANNFGWNRSPTLLVGLGTDEEFLVVFGTPSAGEGMSYTPPQILRIRGAEKTVVDNH